MTTPTTQREADERNVNFPHCLNRTAFISDLTYQMYLAEIESYTRQAAPEAPACQWPTCQPEAVQREVAKEVHAELYGAAPEVPATTDFNGDALYAAWHKVGADVAGLHFADFIAALGSRPPVAAPDAPAHEDPRITAFYKLRDIAERDEDIESANIIQLAISKLHWAKVDAAATTASASDGAIYESVSRRANPEGHAEAMAQVDAVLGRAPAPSREDA